MAVSDMIMSEMRLCWGRNKHGRPLRSARSAPLSLRADGLLGGLALNQIDDFYFHSPAFSISFNNASLMMSSFLWDTHTPSGFEFSYPRAECRLFYMLASCCKDLTKLFLGKVRTLQDMINLHSKQFQGRILDTGGFGRQHRAFKGAIAPFSGACHQKHFFELSRGGGSSLEPRPNKTPK